MFVFVLFFKFQRNVPEVHFIDFVPLVQ